MKTAKNINDKEFAALARAAQKSIENPGKSQIPLPKTESKKFPQVYVFRHTQTYDNARRIFSGRRNTTLTSLGNKQAKELSLKLKNKKIDLFISSPQKRCLETVVKIMKLHPEAILKLEPLLRERDYGDLTGRSKRKLMKENFKMAVLVRRGYDIAPPHGESLKTVKEKRVYPFLKKLVKEIKRKKMNVAICATGNTVRFIRMYFEKLPLIKALTIEIPYDDYAAYIVK